MHDQAQQPGKHTTLANIIIQHTQNTCIHKQMIETPMFNQYMTHLQINAHTIKYTTITQQYIKHMHAQLKHT